MFDIQKETFKLVTTIQNEVKNSLFCRAIVKRTLSNIIELSINGYRLDITYLGSGVYGIDPVFSDPMVCYSHNKDHYSFVVAVISKFNMGAIKRYEK